MINGTYKVHRTTAGTGLGGAEGWGDHLFRRERVEAVESGWEAGKKGLCGVRRAGSVGGSIWGARIEAAQ